MITTLRTADGAQVQIAHNGAQVISWIPANQPEQLFLSKTSSSDAGAALRGGVPVIFPQFASLGLLPKHGFARTQLWHKRASDHPDRAVFELRDNEITRAIWPHAFWAELTVTLSGAELEIELAIHNTGNTEFSFTCALHTYLRVEHIEQVRVIGLQGTHYRDSVIGVENCVEMDEVLTIHGQVDRIYMNAPTRLDVQQARQRLAVFSNGFADAVVWNPGAELGRTLADLEPNGYERMLCVEAAAIAEPICLPIDATWRASQRLVVQPSARSI
ncbi:D-hexose-6-phosphate mutarotase [Solimicrobium silvestre]|uniref:Putative glucose-6-phosphate 1-epimerase n=1 Tax=Solimicrobium silvestre TaxID=2099400 RepID=A0A2S9H166_9BURK|nr:D-hexose-6-phosphate mutarotase [Solimicrobium silvestre]PRC93690.1 putative enzymes related to aldose 1-epimerase [Solimicrobium silvestre]